MLETRSYTQMRDDFCAEYKRSIVPAFLKFNKERSQKILIANIVKTILIILATLFLYQTFTGIKNNSGNYIFPLILAMLSGISIYSFNFLFAKNIEISIKKKVMPILCQLLGDLTWIDGKGGFAGTAIYKRSLLASNFDSTKVDDIFVGKFDNIKVDILDTELLKKQSNAQIKVFAGSIIKLDIGKSFCGHTIIPFGANATNRKHFASKLSSITLNETGFTKPIDIYTNAEDEAKKYITPKFIECIENIRRSFFAKQLTCIFYENCILIGLNAGSSLFETASLTKSLNNSKKFFNVYERYLAIIKFIDYIKLTFK